VTATDVKGGLSPMFSQVDNPVLLEAFPQRRC
jgi:hypothetical protein